MTTLENIRIKIRRLTASPSPAQITDVQINSYINTFYLDDLPQHLKLLDLKSTYTFYSEPNIDLYDVNFNPSFTDDTVAAYYSLTPLVYISGSVASYSQSKAEFNRSYPFVNSEDTLSGDGTVGPYAITVTNSPVLRNMVTISATDSAGNNLVAYDDGSGALSGDATGVINYVTGAITALTFTGLILATETITVQTAPYVANKPNSVLFSNNKIKLRPVPDKTYRIDIDAMIYPTVLLDDVDNPNPHFLWQLLAIGASKKILEDRGDIESVSSLMPLFNEQMTLCQRRTIQQQTNSRTATIYSNSNQTFGGHYGLLR